MKLKILYEDNHIMAVEKEPGILTQQDSSGALSLLDYAREYIKQKYNKPGRVFLGLVNRIDRPVSGIVIFARSSKAAQRLHREFSERKTMKIYVALTERSPDFPPGGWIERDDELVRLRGRTALADHNSRNVRDARMKFTVVAADDRHSLLLVRLVTGRKHQIRTQLAALGMPIVGDELYGSREAAGYDSICLHAHYLRFSHPTKPEPIEIVSPLPERMRGIMKIGDGTMMKIAENISLQLKETD